MKSVRGWFLVSLSFVSSDGAVSVWEAPVLQSASGSPAIACLVKWSR
jgi:hypothetical protein